MRDTGIQDRHKRSHSSPSDEFAQRTRSWRVFGETRDPGLHFWAALVKPHFAACLRRPVILGSPAHYLAGRTQHIKSVFYAELVRRLWQEAEALLPSVH